MGKQHVTIADVAEKANVSKMTVSRVINNKGEISETTRQRILQVMDELGYRPNRIARSLATNTTLRIGILVPALSNPYFGAIIEGAESVLWENDYHILLGHSGGRIDREQAVMEIFEDNRVDGVMVLSARSSLDEMNHYLHHQRAAVVINTPVKAGIAARLYTDEIRSMALAVHHLMKLGRRHLGYMGLNVNTYASNERQRGFVLAVENAGLLFDEKHQIRASEDNVDATGVFYDLLTHNPQIDGLVCFNTGIAVCALQVCAQLGRRVPEDVAVVGYDDIYLAEVTNPPLTTLDLTIPRYEVGAMAARLLLERIEGDDHAQEQADVILEHKLIIRDSAP
jgi:LacI family transcriptional regulator